MPTIKKITVDEWISDFICAHQTTGYCTIQEWEQFSDIYKDERGVRPRWDMGFEIVELKWVG